jgi:uncharacterized protein YodC (DUF2158 family)
MSDEAYEEFLVGDVVVLNSKGPKMTVVDIELDGAGDQLRAHCQWFGGDPTLKQGWFHVDTITHFEVDPSARYEGKS